MKTLHVFFPLLFTLLIGVGELIAQGTSMLSPTLVGTATTNYFFAKPNELTISVDVLGYVQRPGRYEISNSVNLVNLVTLAGGASTDGTLDNVKITRLVEVDGKQTTTEIRVNINEISKLSASDLVLHPGDVIQIEKTGWSSFRDVFSAVVSVAIITSAIAQVAYFTRR